MPTKELGETTLLSLTLRTGPSLKIASMILIDSFSLSSLVRVESDATMQGKVSCRHDRSALKREVSDGHYLS